MAHFVLVHGSGQNASCWSPVSELLAAQGHTVAAPDLPKQASDWKLEDHAARIAESIEGPDTVVVAHSMCGAFLPLVAQVRECALLVFLAAVIPEAGKSMRDQFTEDSSMFSQGWIDAGARWFDESQQESLCREFLFHDCDETTFSWALGTVEMIDTQQLITQPAPFARWPDVPAAAIVATEDRTLTPDWGRRMSRRTLQRKAIEIRAGHCPHMSRPDRIAALLAQLATRGSV